MVKTKIALTPDNETITLPTSGFMRDFDEHVRAGYQITYVCTSEEGRVEGCINHVANKLKTSVITWDCVQGFDTDALKSRQKEFANPLKALEALEDNKVFSGDHIFIFRDLDDYMKDANVRRRLRSLAEGNRLVNKRHKRPLIIISPILEIHKKLRASISVIEFSLPGEEQLLAKIDFVRTSIESKNADRAELSDELRLDLAQNFKGLTDNETENCLSRCLVRHGGFTPDMLTTIKEEKASIVKKGEVLTYVPETTVGSLSDIGGWDLYRDWLNRRKLAYLPSAREFNLDFPKGCILIGPPGTGKSVVAKATSQILNLPAYILDVGSLFGSMVGESEQRTRDVLKQIDAQQGCVLVIDEADKALGNAHSSTGDSGVTRRVFGTILSWLAENKSKTFVIMTLNRTEGMPPELTRAGRFDAMFFTDLPNEAERRTILEIHLRKRGVDPASIEMTEDDWAELIEKTSSFVGSELEVVIVEARYLAFQEEQHGTPSFEHLMEVTSAIVPMSTRDPEGMAAIRAFCNGKAQPVTTPNVRTNRKRTRTVSVDSADE